MSSKFVGTAGAVLLFSLLASAAEPKAAAPSHLLVNLAPVRGSGASGTATLTQKGTKLTIVIKMTTHAMNGMMTANGSPKMMAMEAMGAHIHRGSCPNPEHVRLYPLQPVVNGTSTTTLTNVDLAKLTSGQYTISIHKSTTDVHSPIACGDTKLVNPGGTSGE